MRNNSGNNAVARGIFETSQRALAEIGAVIVTFFLTPIAYAHSSGWVRKFTSHYYGEVFLVPVDLAWAGIVVLAIYFISRITVSTCLMVGSTALLLRLFG
ncbi:MAG: hypothetical protein JKY99_12705 [Rhizobiales bacterium]|nr:hypothetical protein [Hyphomicrobiales bacterium]